MFVELDIGYELCDSAVCARHAPDEHPAVIRPPIAHDFVSAMVFEVSGREASRERLRKPPAPLALFLFRHAVERVPVHRRYLVHIVGRFHAALDFQRGDSGFHEVVEQVYRAEVLRRQKVLALGGQRAFPVITMQFVGQPACLGAQSPVCRSTADHRRHQALTRVADAQSPVSETFDFHVEFRGERRKFGDFGYRELACQSDAFRSHSRCGLDPRCAVYVHLRRCMQLGMRHRALDCCCEPRILHDERVCARFPCSSG